MPVTDSGDQEIRKLLKVARSLNRKRIAVGIHGEDGGADYLPEEGEAPEATIAEIATDHEFGTGKLPERSFIRSWFDANKGRNQGILMHFIRKALEERDASAQPFHGIGSMFVGDCQVRISEGKIVPALSQRTIDLKGSSVPLIDTGQLRSSIRYSITGAEGDVTMGARMGPAPTRSPKPPEKEKRSRKRPKDDALTWGSLVGSAKKATGKAVKKTARKAGKAVAKAPRKAVKLTRTTIRKARKTSRATVRIISKGIKAAKKAAGIKTTRKKAAKK